MSARCTRHDAAAGWHCAICATDLCADCVAGASATCAVCERPASVIRVRYGSHAVAVLGPESPRGALGPRRPLSPVAELRRLLFDGADPAALAHFDALDEAAAHEVDAATLCKVGQAAAGAGDNALAIRALRAAGHATDRAVAARAMVLLGRVFAERVHDRDSAERVFRHVVESFPGTEAARFASEQLSRPPAR